MGERMFDKVQMGRGGKGGGDSPWRSIVKAVLWRMFAACNTLVTTACAVVVAASRSLVMAWAMAPPTTKVRSSHHQMTSAPQHHSTTAPQHHSMRAVW